MSKTNKSHSQISCARRLILWQAVGTLATTLFFEGDIAYYIGGGFLYYRTLVRDSLYLFPMVGSLYELGKAAYRETQTNKIYGLSRQESFREYVKAYVRWSIPAIVPAFICSAVIALLLSLGMGKLELSLELLPKLLVYIINSSLCFLSFSLLFLLAATKGTAIAMSLVILLAVALMLLAPLVADISTVGAFCLLFPTAHWYLFEGLKDYLLSFAFASGWLGLIWKIVVSQLRKMDVFN